jgi:heme/copper-type cytochrome/quinol oxidase subunit 2
VFDQLTLIKDSVAAAGTALLLGAAAMSNQPSGDGVHGVEIKKFRVTKKVPRGGDPVTIEFVASAVGQFPIMCSEYCGEGHEDMKGMLVVAAKSAR